ncbi:MAG TPA: family 43 glycosylhydrolase [Clostridia bacterium]|nr:family 43 glycosylhydrolase [Clostridia bacterium]
MIEGKVNRKGNVLVYTRTPVDGEYSTHLAYSAHFAYSNDGKNYRALNSNYGILFATSTITPNNSICEKALKSPFLFHMSDGSFGIIAVRINADGSDDEESRGKLVLWTSEDLIQFREIGLVDLHRDAYVQEAVCSYDFSARAYVIDWRDSDGCIFRNTLSDIKDADSINRVNSINSINSINGVNGVNTIDSASPAGKGVEFAYRASADGPEGAVNGNILQIDGRIGDELMLRWTPLENVAVKVPELITAASAEDVRKVPAAAVYTDGSTALKQVEWDTDKIDFDKPGIYEISGTVTQKVYKFPLASGYADPDILKWNGRYYFIATNDNLDDVGLYVREADTVSGLFDKGVREYLILGRDEAKGFVQTFWAPEFHMVRDELYIFFAVGGKIWGPQSHVMKLKKYGSIIDPDSWEAPVRVIKSDGSYLTTEGITLDMTYFEANEISYLMWSYRIWKSGISSADDSGSMLYIASIDPAEPWRLTSEPVLISRPLYGWENNMRTINNEGPYAIVTDDHIYITYSGGAAGGYTYVLGLLTARKGDDLLNPDNWTKSSAPVLSYYSVRDEYGPGHNTFYIDENNGLMIAYHAQESLKSNLRCTGIRRVHFNIHGVPVFDMSAERDLNAALAGVTTSVKVIKQ